MNQDSPPVPQHIPLDELLAYLDQMTAAFEEHPDPATREAVFGLLQGIDALHRAAFRRLAEFLAAHRGEALLVEAARGDRLLATVFALYDALPPAEMTAQAEAALAPIVPYVESHGGRLRVLNVEGGSVHLEMGGACHGCAGATTTLERGVRQALEENFPGFEEVIVHEPAAATPAPSNGWTPIALEDPTTPAFLQAPVFEEAARSADVPPGTVQQMRLSGSGATPVQVALANVDGEFYAVGDFCPGSMLPLSTGSLRGHELTCPWHGERFDVRSGACLDPARRRDAPRLAVYPVAVEERPQGAIVKVAVNVAPRPMGIMSKE